jgi:hypothetical protein
MKVNWTYQMPQTQALPVPVGGKRFTSSSGAHLLQLGQQHWRSSTRSFVMGQSSAVFGICGYLFLNLNKLLQNA